MLMDSITIAPTEEGQPGVSLDLVSFKSEVLATTAASITEVRAELNNNIATEVARIVDAAPEDLNTLREVSVRLKSEEDATGALISQIAGKASQASVDALVATTITKADLLANYSPYDISASSQGIPTAAQVLANVYIGAKSAIRASFANSKAGLEVAATSAMTFTLSLFPVSGGAAVTIGTITIAAGQRVGTFSPLASSYALAVGDRVKLVAPSTADATASEFSATIKVDLVSAT